MNKNYGSSDNKVAGLSPVVDIEYKEWYEILNDRKIKILISGQYAITGIGIQELKAGDIIKTINIRPHIEKSDNIKMLFL